MMNIMLCGASDLKGWVSETFASVSASFGLQPLAFGGDQHAVFRFDNYSTYIANSTQSLQHADIVVFVLLRKYGKITWEIEYREALLLGKPFLVYWLESTFREYINRPPGDHPDELASLLSLLHEQQRTIIPFNEENFEKQLDNGIMTIFSQGVNLLKNENMNKGLRGIIMNHDYRASVLERRPADEERRLKNLLFDIWEHKTFRKAILAYFSQHPELLSTDEIVSLIDDPEQGVKREAVNRLARFVRPDTPLNPLFEQVVELAKEDTDVGVARRAILSLFEINRSLAALHLQALFPVDDIGIPKRIAQWVNRVLPRKDEGVLPDKAFIRHAEKLLFLCQEYAETDSEWKKTAKNTYERLKEMNAATT